MKDSPRGLSLEVYMLGLVDFEDMQQLQRRLVYEQGERGGASLLLCEHPPTISVGRSGSRAHLLPDDETLRSLGIKVRWVNRGGGCVFHLPGQLAAYIILPLETMKLDLFRYIEGLHATVLDILDDFELRGRLQPGKDGVYLDHSRIATVGVAVNRWIAYHGLTLNVGPFLELFDLIEEPGFGPYPLRQTSMESRRQRLTPMSKVREALIRRFETRFGLERHHIYTQHPLVRQKARPHVYAESS